MKNFLDKINTVMPLTTDKYLRSFNSFTELYNNLKLIKPNGKNQKKLWKIFLNTFYFNIFKDPKIENVLDIIYLFNSENCHIRTLFTDFIRNYQKNNKKNEDTIYLDKKYNKIQYNNIFTDNTLNPKKYKIKYIDYFRPQGLNYIIEYFNYQGLKMDNNTLVHYKNRAKNYIYEIEKIVFSDSYKELNKIEKNTINETSINKYMLYYIKKIEGFLKQIGLLSNNFKGEYNIISTDKPLGLFSVGKDGKNIYFYYYNKNSNKKLDEIINVIIHEYIHYLQYKTAQEIDTILTPNYIYEGYAHYIESLIVYNNFLHKEGSYPQYMKGYYMDSLMRLYRYYYCYLYHNNLISKNEIYNNLYKLYNDKLYAENETIRILMNPYICSYYLLKEMYLEKLGYNLDKNKKIITNLEEQRKVILGF